MAPQDHLSAGTTNKTLFTRLRRKRRNGTHESIGEASAATDWKINEEPKQTPLDFPNESPLWQEAMEKLDAREKNWIAKYIPGESNDVLVKDLIEAVQQKEKQFKKQDVKFKFRGQPFKWTEHAATIIQYLTLFGDIANNLAPPGYNLIWKGVKTMLQFPKSQCETMVAILGTAELILNIVVRGSVYEDVIAQTSGRLGDSGEQLRETLIKVYQKSLELLAVSAKYLNSGSLKNFVRTIGLPKQAIRYANSLESAEKALSLQAQACQFPYVHNEHMQFIAKLDRLRDDLLRSMLQMVNVLENQELEGHLEFLSKVRVSEHHEKRSQLRMEKTCVWLPKEKKFRDWDSTQKSSTLWLKGKVGVGKSLLVSKVIDLYNPRKDYDQDFDEVADQHSDKDADKGFHEIVADEMDESADKSTAPYCGVAFWYCSKAKDKNDQFVEAIRSFIRQLARNPDNDHQMHHTVFEFCKKYRLEVQFGPKRDVWKDLLLDVISRLPQTYLIVDALDECSTKDAEAFIDLFGDLVRRSHPTSTVKIFFSSREEIHISGKLSHFQGHFNKIDVGQKNQNDIYKYIDEMLRTERCEKWSSDLKREVIEVLRSRSQGMFQWTHLQLQQLLDIRVDHEKEVRERLKQLPKSLEEAYDKLVEQLCDNEKKYLKRIVIWVMYASQPLTTKELLGASRFDDENDNDGGLYHLREAGDIDEEGLRHICKHLIVCDASQWRFAHASVHEYFQQEEHRCWAVDGAPEKLARLFLLILIKEFGTPEILENENEAKVFSNETANKAIEHYVSKYWPHQVRLESEKPSVSPLLRKFVLGDEIRPVQEVSVFQRLLRAFVSSYKPKKRDLTSSLMYREWCKREANWRINSHGKPIDHALFGIIALDLFPAIMQWKDCEINVEKKNRYGLRALALAAWCGQVDTCRELIRLGSDVNRDPGHHSALTQAVTGRKLDCTKLLAQEGAEFQTCTLSAAAKRGSLEIVRCLVERGADVNADPSGFGSALEQASRWGHYKMVQFLIDSGANVNAHTRGFFGSALAAASFGGSLDCIRFLVEKGADVNAITGGDFGSALAAASYGGSLDCIRFLIEMGADVNAITGGDFGSALAAASYGGSLDCIRFLIEMGADVNAITGGDFGSALAAASYGGSLDCIRFLIEMGADVNAITGGDFGSALAAASYKGKVGCMQFLIDKGADIHATAGPRVGSALMAAYVSGNERAMQFLQDRGATFPEVTGEIWVPVLKEAAAKGALKCARHLTSIGTQFSAETISTAYKSDELFPPAGNCLSFLINHAIEIDAPWMKDDSGIMLAIAAGLGQVGLVKRLVGRGAMVNARVECQFGSVLGAALLDEGRKFNPPEEFKRYETVEFLLKEAGADPQKMMEYLPDEELYWWAEEVFREDRARIARFLLDGNYLTEQGLDRIGYET
ncbi:Ankyrin repeat-containing domain protein [Moelleriella libera RCEF 2490]|uniref:Ankyrin repeat-containing domain protein n=1 Tax=Moelleriella libera RCEF 2490 TaxID=1081109 RepID=A0A162I6A5_9HYPO|nr:Ankyrin repeat-containing domain protein [Moelleriella libera RCEF 2490]